MQDFNLIQEIENNLDQLIVNNNFNTSRIYENIKGFSIQHTINHFHEKASFNDLIDYVFLSEISTIGSIDSTANNIIMGFDTIKKMTSLDFINAMKNNTINIPNSGSKMSHTATSNILNSRLHEITSDPQLSKLLSRNDLDLILSNYKEYFDQKQMSDIITAFNKNMFDVISNPTAISHQANVVVPIVDTSSISATVNEPILSSKFRNLDVETLFISKDPEKIMKAFNNVNVDDISLDLKIKLINNKDLFYMFREDIRGIFKQSWQWTTGNSPWQKYSDMLSSIPNLKDKVASGVISKDQIKLIFTKHEEFGIKIPKNTLKELGDALNIVDIANSVKSGKLLDVESLELAKQAKELYGLSDSSALWTLSKWTMLLAVIAIVFNKSRRAVTFVFYKRHIENLIKFFKNNDYFNTRVTTKLLKYEDDFENCSNYRRFASPIKMTLMEKESFKIQTCFIKYIGASFLFLMRQYKDYLKYKNIQVPGRLETPADLLNIRDERINVNIKNSLFNMNKIVNVFLDDMYKNRLNILFKLIISDNFDISRFEFDDFK